MSWEHIEYGYATAHLFHKMLMWANKNCNIYFSLKLNSDDSWIYYSGNASHALETGLKLTLASTEAEAQTNYLTTTRDSSGKVLAVLPSILQAKYVKVHIESGANVVIREFRPSTFFTAHEIITGDLEITDQLSDAPKIRVTQNSVDRVKIGNLYGTTYGIAGYTVNATTVFELSGSKNIVASWVISKSSLKSGNITLDSKNDKITVNTITIDGANNRIRSSNYVTNNSGFTLEPDLLEVGNIRARGMIQTAVFEKEAISAVGGNLLIRPSDVLNVDMTATYTSLTIEGNETFESGDILRIKDGSYDEWLEITDASSAPKYLVTRDKANTYPVGDKPAWKKGAGVVSYGQSGDGGIYITSSETISPYISVITHAGNPWSETTEKMRFGKLGGFIDYSSTSNLYGIGIGDTQAYLKYDSTNGLRIKGQIELSASSLLAGGISLSSGGYLRTNTGYPYLEMSQSGLQLKTGATGGSYGACKYSVGGGGLPAGIYGYGALIWIMNSDLHVPWAELDEPVDESDNGVASIRLYNRSGSPSGSAEIGDLAVVDGKLVICTIAGSGGTATWTIVGTQTA